MAQSRSIGFLKRFLFQIIGPNAYRFLHAQYFLWRLIQARKLNENSLSNKSEKFFGSDLIAFSNRIQKGNYILDIGAFLGSSTVLFADAVGKTGQVIAFEPIHFNALNRILKRLKLIQVKLNPLALGNESGQLEFLLPIYKGIPLYSQSGFTQSYSELKSNPNYIFEKIPAEMMRLDDFILKQKIKAEDIAGVKIDVEGAELSVLEGGEKFFESFKGFLLCEFWFDQMPPPGWVWLRKRGYHCRYLIQKQVPKKPSDGKVTLDKEPLLKNETFAPADTEEQLRALCEGGTYGNFFFALNF